MLFISKLILHLENYENKFKHKIKLLVWVRNFFSFRLKSSRENYNKIQTKVKLVKCKLVF